MQTKVYYQKGIVILNSVWIIVTICPTWPIPNISTSYGFSHFPPRVFLVLQIYNKYNIYNREWKKEEQTCMDLAWSVRREKFLHFSGILWLSRACTGTKFSPTYQKRWLIISRWSTWLLGPQVPSPRLSSHLSLTVAFSWLSLTPICWLLWDLAFPCLLLLYEILCTSLLCRFRAKTEKGILWLAFTHTHTHRMNAHHRDMY